MQQFKIRERNPAPFRKMPGKIPGNSSRHVEGKKFEARKTAFEEEMREKIARREAKKDSGNVYEEKRSVGSSEAGTHIKSN